MNKTKPQELIQDILSLFIVTVFVVPVVILTILFALILGKNLYLQIPVLFSLLF